MNALLTNVIDLESSRRMSADDYRLEREEIRATYGESSVEAGAKRDQALAALFYRSGWTQEDLAKAEGCSRPIITRRLLFGRFLAFVPSGHIPPIPSNLSERRFRSYWERTDKAEGNERKRFLEVQRLLQTETVVRSPRRDGLGVKIVAEFGDNKWHKLETIAAHVEQPPESLIDLLSNMGCKNNNWGVVLCERKPVGAKDGTWKYRIIRGGEKIDLPALRQELAPILEELEYQGAQHTARYSPSAVLQCAHRIRKLLETLAQQAAPSR
jgi:hypothetical protein